MENNFENSLSGIIDILEKVADEKKISENIRGFTRSNPAAKFLEINDPLEIRFLISLFSHIIDLRLKMIKYEPIP